MSAPFTKNSPTRYTLSTFSANATLLPAQIDNGVMTTTAAVTLTLPSALRLIQYLTVDLNLHTVLQNQSFEFDVEDQAATASTLALPMDGTIAENTGTSLVIPAGNTVRFIIVLTDPAAETGPIATITSRGWMTAGGSATFTDLTATNASITNAAISNATISEATIGAETVGTSTIGTANISTGNITTLNAGTAVIGTETVTTLNATTANIGTANITSETVGTSTVGTEVVTNSTITNLTATNLTVTNLGTCASPVGNAFVLATATSSHGLTLETDCNNQVTLQSSVTGGTVGVPIRYNAAFPNQTSNGNVLLDNSVASVSNKALLDSTTTIANNLNPTKTIAFNAAGNSGSQQLIIASSQSTTQTATVPNIAAADSFVMNNTAASLTNKTITDTSNSVRATRLATTGSDVVISTGAGPTGSGQVLTSTSTTAAAWSAQSTSASSLQTTGSPVVVSGASPPSAGQVLTASSPTTASWVTGVTALATPGSPVTVNAIAPGGAGYVLTSTSTTSASWELLTATSSTYIPSLTSSSGVLSGTGASVTFPGTWCWSRVGNVITMSGQVVLTYATGTGSGLVAGAFDFAPPVTRASNAPFTSPYAANGYGYPAYLYLANEFGAYVIGDTLASTTQLQFNIQSQTYTLTSAPLTIQVQYTIA